MLSLQFIGGGNMGSALLAGLIKAGWAKPKELAVVETLASRREELAGIYPKVTIQGGPISGVDAVLALKPNDCTAALKVLKENQVKRVLSIAAGVRISAIEQHLGEDAVVVRAMPNTPATVGMGAAAIAAGSRAGAADMDWADAILHSVGKVVRVDESLLDAVTGLSGSGPAYVFYLAEALIEAGTAVGLEKDTASILAVQTLLGSALMLTETDVQPEELRRQVTSPQGTTEKGIEALENANVREAFRQAVMKAAERAGEIADEVEKNG